MQPLSRLGRQLQEAVACLERAGSDAALIGGLALARYKVVRATLDVDLLADASCSGDIERELASVGYACLHRSPDAATYVRGDERVDLLYASRPIARHLLQTAGRYESSLGTVRVIGLEGLVAFKLQGLVNDPRRSQDLEDIKALLRANHDTVDIPKLREYFRLFEREYLLDEILGGIR